MSKFRDLFPFFYQRCPTKDDGNWEREFDFSAASFECLKKFYYSEARHQGNYILQLEQAEALCKDLVVMRAVMPEHRPVLIFFQFEIAAKTMKLLAAKRLLNDLFHWIVFSLSDEIVQSQHYLVNHDRLQELIDARHDYIADNFVETFTSWTAGFFYYKSRSGGHNNLAIFFVQNCFKYLLRFVNAGAVSNDLVFAFIQMQNWAYSNKFDELGDECSKVLTYYFANGPDEFLKDISMAFCIRGSHLTHQSKDKWCETALKFVLKGQERLHVLSNYYMNKPHEIVTNFAQIQSAIDEYLNYLHELGVSGYERNYETSRIFNVCSPILNSLLEVGQNQYCVKLIRQFFEIPETKVTTPKMLIIQHNTYYGVQYSFEGKVLRSGCDPLIYSPKLITTLNNFLSTSIHVVDDPNYTPDVYNAPIGTPDIVHGFELEKVLVEQFKFEMPDLKASLSGVESYYLYSEFQLPLQALFIKYCGVALANSQSFMNPKPARKVKRAFIWQGDCNMSEYECNAIEQVFKQKGIVVSRLNWYESNRTAFLNEYGNPSYDLAWVSCHGEFDHYYPERSFLVLNQDNDPVIKAQVSYAELGTVFPLVQDRRLLVLNACDGATTTLSNSPGAIGFGASLVGEYQTLISHQWPTDNYSSMILGILLAIGLSEELDYLDAYDRSIRTFLDGREEVLRVIHENLNDSELLARIKRTDFDYNNLYYYGSFSYLI